ncbi:MAG: ArsI/CadI family heavy metal resistance metalloenzyme [Cyclobacteriaceae bacterium]
MEQKTVFPRTHISLYVKSIDNTVDFYTKFFNTSAAKVETGYAKFELDAPALTISFVENKELAQPSHFGHLGIQVKTKEELNEKLNLARGQKIVELEEMETACCYAIQDKFWVADPDGYEWEVYHFISDDSRMGSKAEAEGEACCSPAEKEGAAACC